MLTLIRAASGAQDASGKPGSTLSLSNTFSTLKKGITYSLFVIGLSLSTVGCVKDDDVQCGDELNPCEHIVIDEIGDG